MVAILVDLKDGRAGLVKVHTYALDFNLIVTECDPLVIALALFVLMLHSRDRISSQQYERGHSTREE